MSLSSFYFLLYFPFLLGFMAVIGLFKKKWKTAGELQLFILLGFSYFFIYSSDWRFCICIFMITVFVYYIGILLEKTHNVKILRGGVLYSLYFLAISNMRTFLLIAFER